VHRTGIIRRAAQHILANVEAVQAKLKPGESITVRAYALELYNEELRDLSGKVQQQQQGAAAAAAGAQDSEGGVRIAERPVGKDGRCIPEVRPAAANADEAQQQTPLQQHQLQRQTDHATAASGSQGRSGL
jgi:hypothetical protein